MSPLVDQCERFIRQILRFKNCCSRIEQEFNRGRLRVTDVELVYSSSFLSICSYWESLLEGVLMEAVCGKESSKPENIRRTKFNNRKDFEKLLLFPGKDYIGLKDLNKAEELSSFFISNGRPFSSVGELNRTHIQQATWIRNAIAHQSSTAVSVFRKKVPGVSLMPATKRTPGAFLRHEFRTSPSQRRYELYFAAFQSAAREIAQAW